jgi:hypothetical protein
MDISNNWLFPLRAVPASIRTVKQVVCILRLVVWSGELGDDQIVLRGSNVSVHEGRHLIDIHQSPQQFHIDDTLTC